MFTLSVADIDRSCETTNILASNNDLQFKNKTFFATFISGELLYYFLLFSTDLRCDR